MSASGRDRAQPGSIKDWVGNDLSNESLSYDGRNKKEITLNSLHLTVCFRFMARLKNSPDPRLSQQQRVWGRHN